MFHSTIYFIQTDARNLTIGDLRTQEVKPIDFYSIKLTRTHNKYMVTEEELLSIVEILKGL